MRQTTKAVLIAVTLSCAIGTYLSGQGPPLSADAGPDQSGMFVGTVVNLSGAASVGATSYAWAFTARPAGSSALLNPTSVTPSFVPDKRGAYTVRLTVGNGTATAIDTVVITTANRPPIAAGGAGSELATWATACRSSTPGRAIRMATSSRIAGAW